MAFYGWRFDPLVSTKNVFTLFIIINLMITMSFVYDYPYQTWVVK